MNNNKESFLESVQSNLPESISSVLNLAALEEMLDTPKPLFTCHCGRMFRDDALNQKDSKNGYGKCSKCRSPNGSVYLH